ncbi:hypothetical protein [Massilia sp. MS-15]|nr:hypothetical protein [Massilia sp. MS-15]
MESILWALDLFAVLFVCRWALREDMAEAEAKAERKQQEQN